jgi:hypothetical protein
MMTANGRIDISTHHLKTEIYSNNLPLDKGRLDF